MTAALVGFAVLFALLFLGIPIAFGMGIVGVVGFAWVVGWQPAFAMVSQITIDTVFNYNFSVLPLFALMGSVFAHSRMADELYDTSYAFIGHRKGGLAMATILACGAFSAVSGSSIACAATMSRVCVPMMRRYGYEPGFAAGTVAVGSTLDILIPPSISMVVYSILTNVDLGKLMIAGFLRAPDDRLPPGVDRRRRRDLATRTQGQRTLAQPPLLRDVVAAGALFTVAIGGIYAGIFRRPGRRHRLVGRLPWCCCAAPAADAFIAADIFAPPPWSLSSWWARSCSANFLTVGAPTALRPGSLLSPVAIRLILALLVSTWCSAAARRLGDDAADRAASCRSCWPRHRSLWYGIFMILVIGIGMIHPPLGMLLFVVRSLVPASGSGRSSGACCLSRQAVHGAVAFPSIVLVLRGCEMARPTDAEIAGAGIGGLPAAAALARRGWACGSRAQSEPGHPAPAYIAGERLRVLRAIGAGRDGERRTRAGCETRDDNNRTVAVARWSRRRVLSIAASSSWAWPRRHRGRRELASTAPPSPPSRTAPSFWKR